MSIESQIQVLEDKVKALISPDPDLFLVELRIKPTNNIKVFIDGDKGVTIERLIQLNRKLYKELEEGGMYPNGDFSLEISSPGLDEPLKLHRQYLKNLDRAVEIIKKDGVKLEGKLVSVTGSELQVEEIKGKGKKAETVLHTVSLEDIKTTKIQIKF